MRRYRIATIGGDGIGPEVVNLTVPVIDQLGRNYDFEVDWYHLPLGAQHFLDTGETLPDAVFTDLRDNYDAILFGAVGDARVPDGRHARDILLGLRFRLDLYVNFRTAWPLAPRLCRLVGNPNIDWVIFRENVGGNYPADCSYVRDGDRGPIHVVEERYAEWEIERIIRAAFVWAAANHRKRVTLVDKANAFAGHQIWRQVFARVAKEFPGLKTNAMYVDAVTHDMVMHPEQFDVLVTTNIFGDTISDEASAIVGGLGVSPSLNLHPGKRPFLAEPVHGSAPTLVGTGRANPLACELTGALMLRQLGESQAAMTLESAVALCAEQGICTPDMGGTSTTAEVGAHLLGLVTPD